MDDTLQEALTDVPQVAEVGDGLPVADDIEKAMTEQVTGDALVPGEQETLALEEAGVALEWLSDLLYTVSKEGVSCADMTMLLELRNKALDRGMELPVCAALETYGDYGFSETRSHLNLTVSQEGIIQTVIDMIKAWVRQFGEWITKAVRTVRNYQHMDAQVKAKLDKVVTMLDEMQTNGQKWRGWSPGSRDHGEELNAKALELFTDGKLKRNRVTAAMLGDPFAWTDVNLIQRDAKSQVTRLTRAMADFQRFIKQEVDIPLVDPTIASFLKEISLRAADLSTESPDKEFLASAKDANLWETFERPLLKDQRDFVAYEFLVEAYGEASDFLRAANRVRDNLSENDHVSEISQAIATINDAYLEMYKLIQFFSDVRKAQVAVVTQYHRYWNTAIKIAFEDMMPHRLVPDATKVAAEKLVAKWNQQMRSWGVV